MAQLRDSWVHRVGQLEAFHALKAAVDDALQADRGGRKVALGSAAYVAFSALVLWLLSLPFAEFHAAVYGIHALLILFLLPPLLGLRGRAISFLVFSLSALVFLAILPLFGAWPIYVLVLAAVVHLPIAFALFFFSMAMVVPAHVYFIIRGIPMALLPAMVGTALLWNCFPIGTGLVALPVFLVVNRMHTGFLHRFLLLLARNLSQEKALEVQSLRFDALARQSEEERGQLELELFQARKMEALGQLAGGVAHDFNNVLAAISGYADLLDKRFGQDNATIRKYSGIMLDACKRATGMISQLLAYTRKGKYQRRVMEMHAALEALIGLVSHSLTAKIRVGTSLQAQHSWFAGDPDQFQNAFLNMAVNARDAMPEGGVLSISTYNQALDKDFTKQHGFQVVPGDYLVLEIADTGIGMPADILQKVFEPYFTTKHGRGTGLGLAGVYGFVKGHNGYITVDSKPGEGSAFRVYLPCAPIPEDAGVVSLVESPVVHSQAPAVPAIQRILVVDDEEPIRTLLQEMLGRMGYQVYTAAGGEEALAIWNARNGAFALLVLDMIMPGMDGRELFQKVKALSPDVKAVIVSGYSRNEQVQQLLDEGVVAHIAKPFQYGELQEAVRKALAGS